MAFAEDLSVFFDTAGFADSAQLNGVAVTGVLDLAGQVEEADVVTVAPTFLLPTASATGATGKAFVCKGVTYTVRSAPLDPDHPDGALTRLVLARV
jgi:hypothetical protein